MIHADFQALLTCRRRAFPRAITGSCRGCCPRPRPGEAMVRSCHIVSADQKEANADAPPFATIARSNFNAQTLAYFLLDPHPKMPELPLSRYAADDIAAYIESLAEIGHADEPGAICKQQRSIVDRIDVVLGIDDRFDHGRTGGGERGSSPPLPAPRRCARRAPARRNNAPAARDSPRPAAPCRRAEIAGGSA